MPTYRILGTGIKTGRKRTRTYEAPSKDEAKIKALEDGTEPSTVELVASPLPTERQLQYARGVGFGIPAGATMREVSDLLSIHEDQDKPATTRHLGFAEYFGVETTRYVGKRRLFDLIFRELSQPGREADLALWFTFRVYRELTRASDAALVQHPSDSRLDAIAKRISSDEKVVQSIRRYRGKDLIWFGQWTSPDGITHTGGSNRTAAYKATANEIRAEFGISKMSPKPSHSKKAPAESSGCLGMLALVCFLPIGISFSAWLLLII